MKAITVIQPWATLLAVGAKGFETRNWQTSYRGPLVIHAGAKKDADCLALCRQEPFRSILVRAGLQKIGDLPFGMALAVCDLMGCYPTSSLKLDGPAWANERAFGDFGKGRFAWHCGGMRRIEPVAISGKQGLWNFGGQVRYLRPAPKAVV